MSGERVLVGNGTHTGQMLGYCQSCGVYHGGPLANAACLRLRAAAAETAEEALAWAALKAAVTLESVRSLLSANARPDQLERVR